MNIVVALLIGAAGGAALMFLFMVDKCNTSSR